MGTAYRYPCEGLVQAGFKTPTELALGAVVGVAASQGQGNIVFLALSGREAALQEASPT